MYYLAKLEWMQPKEGSEEMETKKKQYLVKALSCAEAEGKMLKWCPANYQDPVVTSITESSITDIKKRGESEHWWQSKLGDENEKGKLVPFFVATNGGDHMEVLKDLDTTYKTSEFLELKKLNCIIDEDLINE